MRHTIRSLSTFSRMFDEADRHPLGSDRRVSDTPDYFEEVLGASAPHELIVSRPARRRKLPTDFPWFDPTRDMQVALTQIVGELRKCFGPKIRLVVECPPCADQLCISPGTLIRVIFRLVENAVEAFESQGGPTPQSYVRLSIRDGQSWEGANRISSLPPSGDTVIISVQDNGPGISPFLLPLAFQTGFTTKPRWLSSLNDEHTLNVLAAGGEEAELIMKTYRIRRRGLGLAWVRAVVNKFGGDVRIVSREGRGTRVDVRLPVTFRQR